jgi:DNA-binding CsgD family transcriptional regulator
VSATPDCAVRILRSLFTVDLRESASRVKCPTLVLHARGDRRVPFEEGRLFAGLVPGARFVPLESENHILLSREPAFGQFFEELDAFVPRPAGAGRHGAFPQLTAREAEVLDRIAQGLDNAQIAAHLEISEKTVRNNITRIFDKLAVENRSQAIVLARNSGWGRT